MSRRRDTKFFAVRPASDYYMIMTTEKNEDPEVIKYNWCDIYEVRNGIDFVEMCRMFFRKVFPNIRLRVGEWCELDLSCLSELVIIEEEVQRGE